MPHLNRRGDVAHGVGGNNASVNNVAFCKGAVVGWLDDDQVVFFDGHGDQWLTSLYVVSQQRFVVLPQQTGGNHGYAGGGHCAWWWGTNEVDAAGVSKAGLYSTCGLRLPAAGLLGMGPDASIGYKPDYQSGGPTRVRELTGDDWLLTPGHASDLQLLGNRRALWTEGSVIHTTGLPSPVNVPGGVWAPKALETPAGWWLCYYSDKAGIVLHPWGSLEGFVHLAPGLNGWNTAAVIEGGIIRVATSRTIAEQAGDIWMRDYDVVQNLVRDPLGSNTWQSVPRAVVNPVAPAPAVTALPRANKSLFLGYYKISGKYAGAHNLADACAAGANLFAGGYGDTDTGLDPALRAAQALAFYQECADRGVFFVASVEEMDRQAPFWEHAACVIVGGNTTDELNAAAAAAKAAMATRRLPQRPVLFYLDTILTPELVWPTSCDGIAMFGYIDNTTDCAKAMTAVETRLRSQMALVPLMTRVLVVAQAYDRNGMWANPQALTAIQPVPWTTLVDDPRFIGILAFAYARKGGVLDYPALKAWHAEWFKANAGIPVPEDLTPVPPKPKPVVAFRLSEIQVVEGHAVVATLTQIANCTTWRWLLNDTIVGSDEQAHTFTLTPGTYQIAVRVMGTNGSVVQTPSQPLVVDKKSVPITPEPPKFRRGLQVGFGDLVDPQILEDLGTKGVQLARIKVGKDAETTSAICQQIADTPMRPLLIVLDPEQIDVLPTNIGLDVELFNEPNIGTDTGTGKPVPPAEYIRMIQRAADLVAARKSAGQDINLWVGSLSNFSSQAFAYLDAVLPAIPVWVGITIHWYPEGGKLDPRAPHNGFPSRDAEVAAFVSRLAGRSWAISETGWHTAEQSVAPEGAWWSRLWQQLFSKKKKFRWTDRQILDTVTAEFAWWQFKGAQFVVVYQLTDGPTDTVINRYGLRTVAGVYKPWAAAYKA